MLDALRKTANLTLVTTAHDLTLAGQYADRLLMLDEGRTVALGTAKEVLTAELLSRHYGATVSVSPAPGGKVSVMPIRPGSSG